MDNLQRAMRYDRLGVNDALVRLEGDYNNKLIPAPERLLPTLDQLASDEKYLDMARQRARPVCEAWRQGVEIACFQTASGVLAWGKQAVKVAPLLGTLSIKSRPR